MAALGPELPQGLQRHRRAALRPKAVRARQEVRLEDRLQHQLRRHLRHPVPHRRDPQRSLPSIRLRDVPAQHRLPLGTCLRAARRRAPPRSARPRTARPRRSSGHRRPPRRGSALTRFHASRRTSLLQMRSYSAWKRLPGARLAAAHSRRCSCRTLSRGLRPPGWLGSGLAGHALALTCSSDSTTAGTLPSGRVVRRGLRPRIAPGCGTTIPSDSRCAALAFAFGLYEPPCR